MISIAQPLAERRSLLARMVLTTVNRGGPLSQKDRETLAALQTEMQSIEAAISDDSERRYAQAFLSYLRHGLEPSQFQRGLTAEERQAFIEKRMDSGGAYPGSPTGFFAPIEFHDQVESALKYYGPMFTAATVYDTATGTLLPFPEDNDTAISGEMVPEDGQVTDIDIPISQVVLKSFKFSSRMVKVSVELVQDAGFDLSSYIAHRLGIRIARAANPKFTTGVGTTEPYGIITQAAVGATASGSAANTGGSETGGTSIGTADLAALEQSVDPAYRVNGSYMMHSDTLALLRQLVSKSGLPVFPGLQSGDVDMIFGYPLLINNDMAALYLNRQPSSPQVALKTVAFGNFKKFVIRRAPLLVRRLDQRFADYFQVAYIAFWRMDGAVVDGGGGAVKLLQNVY